MRRNTTWPLLPEEHNLPPGSTGGAAGPAAPGDLRSVRSREAPERSRGGAPISVAGVSPEVPLRNIYVFFYSLKRILNGYGWSSRYIRTCMCPFVDLSWNNGSTPILASAAQRGRSPATAPAPRRPLWLPAGWSGSDRMLMGTGSCDGSLWSLC